MIPPLAPGQKDEGHNMVGWKNTFNMRQVTLMNLAVNNYISRQGDESGCITSPVKSLDILRKNIQNALNKDIDNVIKKYLEKFFQPAVNNIRNNLGRDSVNDEHIKDACCKMLEDAKLMYNSTRSRDSSPYDYSDSETGSLVDYKFGHPLIESHLFRKRKESETDSEASNSILHKKMKLKPTITSDTNLNKVAFKREGPKWNPERITSSTLFIMGARANKILGFGQTRGRLYARHPEIVKYSGDQEDKEWLAQHGLMPPTGGKAYLMILDDIKELSQTDEYKNNPNLMSGDLKGFELPPFMLNKIRAYMESTRTDKPSSLDVIDFQTNHSMTPPSTALDSAPSTPSDTLQMLECQSASTVSSKHSDTNPFDHIPEMSPGSNHSFISGLTQSPVPTTRLALSPSLLMTYPQPSGMQQNQGVPINTSEGNYNNLSALLDGHMNSDNSEEQEF